MGKKELGLLWLIAFCSRNVFVKTGSEAIQNDYCWASLLRKSSPKLEKKAPLCMEINHEMICVHDQGLYQILSSRRRPSSSSSFSEKGPVQAYHNTADPLNKDSSIVESITFHGEMEHMKRDRKSDERKERYRTRYDPRSESTWTMDETLTGEPGVGRSGRPQRIHLSGGKDRVPKPAFASSQALPPSIGSSTDSPLFGGPFENFPAGRHISPLFFFFSNQKERFSCPSFDSENDAERSTANRFLV